MLESGADCDTSTENVTYTVGHGSEKARSELAVKGDFKDCEDAEDEERSPANSVCLFIYSHIVKIIFSITLTALMVFFVWLIISLRRQHVQAHDIGLIIASFFVLGGLPINIWLIVMHLQHYTQPALQKLVIRVLWMVPIYAINSWLALYFTKQAIYFNTFRSCYEAFVVYSFHIYLTKSLERLQGGRQEMLEMLQEKPDYEHFAPFCWMDNTKMGKPFLQMSRRGVLAYVVVRVCTALVAVPLECVGWYGDGTIDFGNGFVYLCIVNNVAAVWGLYCLIAFFQVLSKELAPIRPLPKFLCVKLVVFFSYWQGMLLSVLAFVGVLKDSTWNNEQFSSKDVQNNVQNFLICIEMLFFSIAHHFAFSYREYSGEFGATVDPSQPWYHALWVFDMGDMVADVKEHAPFVRRKASEKTRLLDDVSPGPASQCNDNAAFDAGLGSDATVKKECDECPEEYNIRRGIDVYAPPPEYAPPGYAPPGDGESF